MKTTHRTTPRSLVALLLAAVTLTVGCASFFQPTTDDLTWFYDGKVTTRYEWRVVADPHRDAGCSRGVDACSFRVMNHPSGQPTCLVYSIYTEQEAKKRPSAISSAYTVWEHEVEARRYPPGPHPQHELDVMLSKPAPIVGGHCAGYDHVEKVRKDFYGYGGK